MSMSIEKTQYLSQLSSDEIKLVREKWPNPLMPLGFMMGGIMAMMYALWQHNKGEGSFGMLVGSFVAMITLTVIPSIFVLVKISRAKKALNVYANKYSIPEKGLLQEFRKNQKSINAL